MANCNGCHKPGKAKGKLDMTTFAKLMAGGKKAAKKSVPTIKPGDADASLLVQMISGEVPDMPEDGDPLKPEEVELIRKWIAQGAKDDTPDEDSIKLEPPVYRAAPVVASMAFSPDGTLLAVAGYHEVLLHKADGSGIVRRLLTHAMRIESVAFSPDGKRVAMCGGTPSLTGLAVVWDVETGEVVRRIKVGNDSLYGLSFSPDGKTVAFGSAEKVAYRYTLATGEQTLRFVAHADWVLGTTFNTDGTQLVTGGRDKALKLVDLKTGRFVDDINNPLEAVVSLARHPKKNEVAYGGDLGTPRVYKISDNQKRTSGRRDTNLVKAFERQPAAVTAVAFSPDGSLLAAGSVGEVRVYDMKGKRVATLSGHEGPVFSIHFTPDGQTIATAGFDGDVRLFNAADGKLVKRFTPVPIEGEKKSDTPVAAN